MTLRWLAIALLFSGVTGCAVGSEEDDGVAPRRIDSAGIEEEEEDTGSSSTTDSGSSSTDTSTSPTDSATSGEDTAAPPEDTGSSGTACTTLTSTDCSSSAEIMTPISGDTGGTAFASGTDNKFLRIRVSEDDSGVFSGKDLRARFTLTSTGTNFDLYVYMGKTVGDGGGVECSTVRSSSTAALGSPDVVALMWSDNRPIGGHDDTRFITVEVRSADASCAGASWSLNVEGNK